VLVSAVLAFVIGGLWYSPLLFGKASATLRGLDPNSATSMALPVGGIVGEFVRWLVMTLILARFMARLGVADVTGALTFGAWMWVVVYTALAGSVLHEGYPWRLYAIHAGDGLAKIMLITTILCLWKPR
ncbi:MAG TPA: DUF1761 domain-containing protein, partial [Gemmatimonadales bacterium]|nr:DUF1761 domain-containing protein [Gemmatimonadales bacterium]